MNEPHLNAVPDDDAPERPLTDDERRLHCEQQKASDYERALVHGLASFGSRTERHPDIAAVRKIVGQADPLIDRYRITYESLCSLDDKELPFLPTFLKAELMERGIDEPTAIEWIEDAYEDAIEGRAVLHYARAVVRCKGERELQRANRNGASATEIEAIARTFREAAIATGFGWPKLTIDEINATELAPIPWIVEGVAEREGMTILTADPKSGKTYAAMQIALDAALGRPAFGLLPVPHPLRVLHVDEEMGASKLTSRYKRLITAMQLDSAQLQTLNENLDIRPQCGLSLEDDEQLATFRVAVTKHKPELIIMDSIVALSHGEENSATERRRFYNRVLAPTKAEYGAALLVLAHPPLPSKDAPKGSSSRPRGSGDAIGQADRLLCMEGVGTDKGDGFHTVHSLLGPNRDYEAREGGDIEPVSITIDGAEGQPVSVTGCYSGNVEGQREMGKIMAAEAQVLSMLRESTDRELYQPDLIKALDKLGISKDSYQDAVKRLSNPNAKRIEVTPARKGKGSGKWVELREDSHE